jgi:hypothetical protein
MSAKLRLALGPGMPSYLESHRGSIWVLERQSLRDFLGKRSCNRHSYVPTTRNGSAEVIRRKLSSKGSSSTDMVGDSLAPGKETKTTKSGFAELERGDANKELRQKDRWRIQNLAGRSVRDVMRRDRKLMTVGVLACDHDSWLLRCGRFYGGESVNSDREMPQDSRRNPARSQPGFTVRGQSGQRQLGPWQLPPACVSQSY